MAGFRCALILALAAAIGGCNGLSLRRADRSAGDTVRSVFRAHTPSPAATAFLERIPVATSIPFRPDEAAARVADSTTPEGRLVLAELCDLAGRDAEVWSPSKAPGHYLDAAWYAQSVMLAGPSVLPSERWTDAARIYNHAVQRFLRKTTRRGWRADGTWEEQLAQQGVVVKVRHDGTVWSSNQFDEFRFADDYMAVGVPERRRDGVGVPLLAVRKRWWRDPERQAAPAKFFPPLQVYPVTAVLRFEPAAGTGRPPALLELHDPLRYDAVDLGPVAAPLAADLTTPLLYQVTESDLDKFSYEGLIQPAAAEHKTGIHLSQPYERGKIPVLLIHGLWSSPKTWTRTINDLRADPVLGARYQFWTYQYPTGNPFIHSAALLRRSLAELRATFDPEHTDPAFDQMVVIGHSMGGLIAKSLVADSGDQVWRLISNRPFAELQAGPDQKAMFEQVFFFRPVPEVRRVVFVAVPHKGSLLGSNWIGQIGDWLIRRPNVLVQAHDTIIKANKNDFFTNTFLEGIPSSVKTLRTTSPLLMVVDGLPTDPRVPRHSIIARMAPVPLAMSTDGVVPYASSHREDVVSEKVVVGTHNCLDEPDVIEELGRILREHLGVAAVAAR